jgi:hypothetical protein
MRSMKTQGSLEMAALDAMVSNLFSLCKKLLTSETLNSKSAVFQTPLETHRWLLWACQSGVLCLAELDGRAISKTYLK